MKPSELRIGNKVYYENPHGDRVETDFSVNCFDYISNISPIPLTEEWLVKFGFDAHEHENGNTYTLQINYSAGFKDFISLVNKGGNKNPLFLGSLTTNYQKHFVLSNQVIHVHQLQNLYFALTGEEL